MELIKINDVIALTCLSKASIYRLIKQGSFPKQVHLSKRASAWIKGEILDWISALSSRR